MKTNAKVRQHAATILSYLTAGKRKENQQQISDALNISRGYISMALAYLVETGGAEISISPEKIKGGSTINRKYYSAVPEVPASSVMVK